MKKFIYMIVLVVSTAAIFGQDEELEVKGNVLFKDQVNSMKPPAPILNVPQSVSVITDEDILNQGFRALGDIVRYVPGITSTQGEGHRDAMVIRGVRTTSSFYQDGLRDDVQYYRSLYNVEQVEVLKGPNALLFGRGGEGGLIHRVSKRAIVGESFTNVDVGYDSLGSGDFTVDGNMQLSDTVALRLMAHSDTLSNHRDHYDGDRFGINPSFTFALNEATELNISFEYLDHERFIDRGIPTLGADVDESLREITYGTDDNIHTTEGTILKANLVHNYSDNGKINLAVGGNTFNKMYQNVYVKSLQAAADGTANALVQLEGYRDTTGRKNSFINLTNVNTFDRGTLTVGLDFTSTDNENERYHSHFNNEAADAGGLGASGIRNNFLRTATTFDIDAYGNRTVLDFSTDVKVKSETDISVQSLFLTGDIDLSDQWQMILGVRFEEVDTEILKLTPEEAAGPDNVAGNADDNANSFINRYLTTAVADATNVNNIPSTIQSDDSHLSPRFGLIFKPQENMSLYLSYSESFLPKSGDQYKAWSLVNDVVVDPDVFKNSELGFKYNSEEGLNLSIAYFDSETEKVQADGVGFAENIAFEISGIELSVGGQIDDRNSISASLSSVDAENASGGDQKEIPELTWSLWYTHQANDMFGFSIGAVYQDEQWISSTAAGAPKLPDYTRVDMAMAITPNDSDTIRINIENLLDEDYYPYSHSTHQVSVGEPANVRVSYSKRF